MTTKVTSGLISADAALVDLNIDANTLYIDASANAVGVGTTSPSGQLNVHSSTQSSIIKVSDSVTGNSSTDGLDLLVSGTTGYLWNREAGNLLFGTSNSEQMRISSTGRVGIGETSPDTPFHITATGVGSQGTIKLQGTSSHIGFHQADDTFKTWIGHYNTANHGSDTDFNIKAGYNGGGNIRISADGDTTVAQMYIKGSTGNVGIANIVPQTKLHVGTLTGGDGTAQEMVRISGDYSATGSGSLLRFTNQHDSGSNPNSGEYNIAGIKAWDYRSDWGGAIALQTATPSSGGGNLVDRLVITPDGDVLPGANNSYDLGSTSLAWKNIYTNDLNLSNMPSEGIGTDEKEYEVVGNDVDGTNGSWTIQEGENDLFIINRLNGKKYKFNLEEVE